MRMVAIPYTAALCRVCGGAATHAVREYDALNMKRTEWRLYCDKHGPQAGRGLNPHPDFYQKIVEVDPNSELEG